MCLPALAAVPAALASAGSAIGAAASAIPGFGALSGATKGAFAFAKTASGISALSTAFNAGSSLIGYMGQRQEAATQGALYDANRRAAITAYQDDIVALNTETMLSQEQATQRRMEAAIEGTAQRANARVALGEQGVGGYTAAAIERDLLMAQGTGIAAIDRNDALNTVRHQFAGKQAGNTAKGRIQSVQRGTKPSLLALGASIGGSTFGGLRMYKELKAAEAVT
jgi:hypothetical protein